MRHYISKECETQEGLLKTNAYVMDQLFTYENTSLELYSKKTEEDALTSSLKIISDLDHEIIAANF